MSYRTKFPIYIGEDGRPHRYIDDMEPELSPMMDNIRAQYLANPEAEIVWPDRFSYLVTQIVELILSTDQFRSYSNKWKDECALAALRRVYKAARRYDKTRTKNIRTPAVMYLSTIIWYDIRSAIGRLTKAEAKKKAANG